MTVGAETVECTVHLPGLQLRAGSRIAIGDGELTELSFDAWHALESEFGYAAGSYERARPVFLRVSLDVPSVEPDDWLAALAAAVERVRAHAYRALLLATARPLPEPRLSATYISLRSTVWRLIGPYGREQILYGAEPRVELDDDDLRRLQVAHAILAAESSLPREGALEAALNTLERTTRPDFTYINRYMHEMITLEQLLLPDKRSDLTRTFARRTAALVISAHDQFDEAVEIGQLLYSARSELVHGGDLGLALEGSSFDLGELFGLGRWVLCEVLGRVVVWRATAPAGASLALANLRDELDGAGSAPDRWETLSRRWELIP
jgi:hypothetical protein